MLRFFVAVSTREKVPFARLFRPVKRPLTPPLSVLSVLLTKSPTVFAVVFTAFPAVSMTVEAPCTVRTMGLFTAFSKTREIPSVRTLLRFCVLRLFCTVVHTFPSCVLKPFMASVIDIPFSI